MTAAERLLRYVQFDTQSNEFSDTCPSTDKQKVLALSLVEEMKAMGISDAYMDAEGVDAINGTDWKVTYKAVTSSRLDANALKKALPDLAQQFTKTTTARRFCIA